MAPLRKVGEAASEAQKDSEMTYEARKTLGATHERALAPQSELLPAASIPDTSLPDPIRKEDSAPHEHTGVVNAS
jgi:hypothetical protein